MIPLVKHSNLTVDGVFLSIEVRRSPNPIKSLAKPKLEVNQFIIKNLCYNEHFPLFMRKIPFYTLIMSFSLANIVPKTYPFLLIINDKKFWWRTRKMIKILFIYTKTHIFAQPSFQIFRYFKACKAHFHLIFSCLIYFLCVKVNRRLFKLGINKINIFVIFKCAPFQINDTISLFNNRMCDRRFFGEVRWEAFFCVVKPKK